MKTKSYLKSIPAFCACLVLMAFNTRAQVVNSESFDGTTFVPTGWTDLVISPGCPWMRTHSGNTGYPSVVVNPHSGAGEVWFDSYDYSTGVYALVTPSFDLSARGANTPTVSFWMFRDDGYPTSADKIDVYVNTTASITGDTLLGTINRAINLSPVVASNGWYQYSFNIPGGFTGASNYILFQATSAFGNNMILDDVQWISYPAPCSAHFTVHPDTIPHNWIALNQATGIPPLSYLWHWGDGDSSTGANPSHVYNTPGFYNICLSIADSVGCTSTYCDSSTYLHSPNAMITINGGTLVTNIEEPNQNSLIIYPNPLNSSSILQLNTPLKNAEVVIYDIVGKELMRKKLTGNTMEIDKVSLERGVYFVRVVSEEKQWVEKLVVE